MLGNSIRNDLVPICVTCTSFSILGVEIGPLSEKKTSRASLWFAGFHVVSQTLLQT